ncbi:hypothetical protein BMH32_07725 [Leucobacter sp. OLJS4]|uniref:helix-turn-helix transcriptional regulator n=1 Tax=unclassified Leucobacter TaxID=2621730 RepID=UPI000C199418|nr:hypothetical protein BMH26_10075 [Leucobacter sp. OLTLW20]PII94471.1 hypothetical protein BMH27_00325 [Leucobacter sp. OLAS13]PIJ00729.1 hypothetical protein BMH29_01190 [Leucobacter sp. OLDS2]PIJ03363.1 hypothetical protein BMH31_07770 [Leucobacter sp. OLIS6]PIJ03658.1 hypothetical protein BMH28_03030 [Leucobacter sp. OLCS4]PIJ11098.1 hypothetical protein BMH32_07725 [Leucobacter sp. OLJS4]PIJ52287.1 hypothetical protein BMH30_03170 [Leucobacter sp. OLES1]PIJ53476.1 hypothetical protein 
MRADRPGDFSRIVKTKRHELHLTQQNLADRAGVTRQLVARLENGTGDPSLSNTLKVLAALGVSLTTAPASEHYRLPLLPPAPDLLGKYLSLIGNPLLPDVAKRIALPTIDPRNFLPAGLIPNLPTAVTPRPPLDARHDHVDEEPRPEAGNQAIDRSPEGPEDAND